MILIAPESAEDVAEKRVSGAKYADDSNYFTEMGEDEYAELQKNIETAKKEGGGVESPVPDLFAKCCKAIGLAENKKKRIVGGIVGLCCRLLGVWTDAREDLRRKWAKSWAAAHKVGVKLAGVKGLSAKLRGGIITAYSRSALTYGLECRGVDDATMQHLQVAENRHLAHVAGMPKWKRESQGVTLADLRFRHGILPIQTFVGEQKANFFGHVMRRTEDDLPRKALSGMYFPKVEESGGQGGKHWHFWGGNGMPGKRKRAKATILGDIEKFFKPHMPIAALRHIVANDEECRRQIEERRRYAGEPDGTVTDEEVGRLKKVREKQHHLITKSIVIAGLKADAARGAKISGTEIEERCDFLKGKWGLGHLDPEEERKKLFAAGMCFICEGRFADAGTASQWSECQAVEKLEEHLGEAHSEKVTDEARDLRKKFEKEEAKLVESMEGKILAENEEHFVRTGASRYGLTPLFCMHCNVNYKTTLGAMVAHKEAHEAGEYTTLWKTRVSNNRHEYRPTEHILANDGRMHAGSDAKFVKVIVPENVRVQGEKHYCRRCNIHSIDLHGQLATNVITRRINVMHRHERGCTIDVEGRVDIASIPHEVGGEKVGDFTSGEKVWQRHGKGFGIGKISGERDGKLLITSARYDRTAKKPVQVLFEEDPENVLTEEEAMAHVGIDDDFLMSLVDKIC
jgi:hypothetical protein